MDSIKATLGSPISKLTDSELMESINEDFLIKSSKWQPAPWLAPEWPWRAQALEPSPVPEPSFHFKGKLEKCGRGPCCTLVLGGEGRPRN